MHDMYADADNAARIMISRQTKTTTALALIIVRLGEVLPAYPQRCCRGICDIVVVTATSALAVARL